MIITSRQNPKVKQLVKLRKTRDDLFLIEGYRELLRAVDSGWEIVEAYFCPELFLGENEEALLARIATRTEMSKDVFAKVSYRDRPDGLLAIARKRSLSLDAITIASTSCFVIAEAIEKPGNLGSILRSCDATGVSALIVCDKCTDIYNPNVVRASVGTLFSVPVIEATTDEVFAWAKKHRVRIVATTPAATHIYTDENLKGPIGIAVGTEQLGLSRRWLDEADVKVRIPMCGIADSLNVAAATTLLLYEQLRQR